MMDLEVWACPACRSSLTVDGDRLHCPREGLAFERRGDLHVLIAPDDRPLLLEADGYVAAWTHLGWIPPIDRLPDLPFIQDRPYRGIWRQKSRAFENLLEVLGPAQQRRVADVGAGTGWLSYRLAQRGFRCYATDIVDDERIGLGALPRYAVSPKLIERALASLRHWPFHDESLDVAICNASLHYLADVEPAVAEAQRVLKRGGVFVIMNEPIHADATSAESASSSFRSRLRRLGGTGALVDGYSHLVASELEGVLRPRFRSVTKHTPRYGYPFRASRWAKGLVLRMELASFPLYEAIK